ncbi:4-phosphoerythronate dehydrogenase [Actinomadura sp. NBRC 104425]|nr:4-phosphoerythronate dehydrogenase [Actinomadura sp. NBRC 104425]
MTDMSGSTGEVVVTTQSFARYTDSPWRVFEEAGVPARRSRFAHPLAEDELVQEAAGAAALIVGLDPVTARVIEAAPSLRVIAKHGVGVDNIDVAAAKAAGIRVVNAPGANTTAVADMTMALLLAAVRQIVPAHSSVVQGRWDRFFGPELAGRTLAVIGFGRIGQAVARRARGFDMTVVAHDPHLPAEVFAEHGVRAAGLDECLQAADAVTLHLPLAPGAPPLLGRAELARLRPGAYLVNTARGGLVDEAALAEALREGRLAGAAVDVFASEPPHGSPLLDAPNVVLTPHCGAFSHEANAAMGTTVATDVVRVLRGLDPANPVV